MSRRVSTTIFSLALCLLAAAVFSGCASVKATSAFYFPYTAKYYPPKPSDAAIPILGQKPPEPYTAIGRLAFATDQGWGFLRKSMIYNAQVNGADAVILKQAESRDQTSLLQVPPQIDWVPSGGYVVGRHGRVYSYNSWYPIFRPGYVQPYTQTITRIDAEMIVFKK